MQFLPTASGQMIRIQEPFHPTAVDKSTLGGVSIHLTQSPQKHSMSLRSQVTLDQIGAPLTLPAIGALANKRHTINVSGTWY